MKKEEKNLKEEFVEPKVLASYRKEDLEEIIKPHGNGMPGGCSGGCGCGCGCGGG